MKSHTNLIVLAILVVANLIAGFNTNERTKDDNFFVNEDNDELSYIFDDEPSISKKENIVTTRTSKPAVHNMALSLQPEQHRGEGLSYYKPAKEKTENANKRLHIAPTINLAQTLTTLDHIGPKKSIGTNDKHISTEFHSTTKHDMRNETLPNTNKQSQNSTDKLPDNLLQIVRNNASSFNHSMKFPANESKPGKKEVSLGKHLEIGSMGDNPLNQTQDMRANQTTDLTQNNLANQTHHSNTTKKDAQPNVITDSAVKGFLGKDPNFTIDDVGNRAKQNATEEAERLKKERKKQEEMEEQREEKEETKEEESNELRDSKQNNKTISTQNVTAGILEEAFTHHELPQSSNLQQSQNKTTLQNKQNNEHNELVGHAANQTITKVEHRKYTRLPKLHLADMNDFALLKTMNKTLSAKKKDNIDASVHEECNADKECPKNKYCRHYQCYECHRKHHECVEDDQCCDGILCVYGRCDDKPKGSPGTICDKDDDCGADGCCIIEPTIDEEHGICKKKLLEYHQCSPVLFRKVWVGDHKPKCGPCKDGLDCVEKGCTKCYPASTRRINVVSKRR